MAYLFSHCLFRESRRGGRILHGEMQCQKQFRLSMLTKIKGKPKKVRNAVSSENFYLKSPLKQSQKYANSSAIASH